jgi:hypothetical protein
MGGSLNAGKTQTAALQATHADIHNGFDPGFDNLIGDGDVDRQFLGFDALTDGEKATHSLQWSAFAVPAGAAQPEHFFEGSLELTGSDLPALNVEFVQIGNHLFPLARGALTDDAQQWDYAIGTGRVWREASDAGYSRASIPLVFMSAESRCTKEGALTFLFHENGDTSRAAYQMAERNCGSSITYMQGVLEATYSPATVGNEAIEIESVMACAAESWLPLVQGQGGIDRVLSADGRTSYELSGARTVLWLDAATESAAIESLCE